MVKDIRKKFIEVEEAVSEIDGMIICLKDRFYRLIYDTIDEEDISYYPRTLPDHHLALESWRVSGDTVVTEWGYVDSYDNIMDDRCMWVIYFSLFSMSDEDLKKEIKQICNEEETRDYKEAFSRVQQEANNLGFRLVPNSDPE